MSYKAIGENTKKVYASGDHRRDCLRKLQKEYPYSRNIHSKRIAPIVFPEPILIVRSKECKAVQ